MDKPKFKQVGESVKIPSRSSVKKSKITKQESAIQSRPITPGPTRAFAIDRRERSKVNGNEKMMAK